MRLEMLSRQSIKPFEIAIESAWNGPRLKPLRKKSVSGARFPKNSLRG